MKIKDEVRIRERANVVCLFSNFIISFKSQLGPSILPIKRVSQSNQSAGIDVSHKPGTEYNAKEQYGGDLQQIQETKDQYMYLVYQNKMNLTLQSNTTSVFSPIARLP